MKATLRVFPTLLAVKRTNSRLHLNTTRQIKYADRPRRVHLSEKPHKNRRRSQKETSASARAWRARRSPLTFGARPAKCEPLSRLFIDSRAAVTGPAAPDARRAWRGALFLAQRVAPPPLWVRLKGGDYGHYHFITQVEALKTWRG